MESLLERVRGDFTVEEYVEIMCKAEYTRHFYTDSEIEALEDAFDLIENGAFDAAEDILSDLLAKNNNNAANFRQHTAYVIEQASQS